MELIKKWDVYGKPVTFYLDTSTVHKTLFGGLLSIFSFSLMMSITITSLVNFLYQKPVINSNIVFFINKKFKQLEGMEIKGQLISENKVNTEQLDKFIKYYRIVLHEKYEDDLEIYRVANLVKENYNKYQFNVKMSISDVFKEKTKSSLKIMSCKELQNIQNIEWVSPRNATSCDSNFERYFINNYVSNNYLFSFDAPIYTVDRKGNLQKVSHQNELRFKVENNKKFSFVMDTKYVVIEDDSNIYYTNKKYDAYFTMKRPVQLSEENTENDYSLELQLKNLNNDQMILISIYKYKLLDFLAKLGGIMKIITFMKMTGKFWSSFFYEKTLYNLIINRKNTYLEQKKELLETSIYKNTNKMQPVGTPESGDSTNIVPNDNSQQLGPFVDSKDKKKKFSANYASYCSWFLNRFCKLWYLNKEAKQKRLMLTDTLGLTNYLLHLDYIDRQIILEQQTGEINKKIEEIINKNKGLNMSNNNNNDDSNGTDQSDEKVNNNISLIDNQENNMKKPLTMQQE